MPEQLAIALMIVCGTFLGGMLLIGHIHHETLVRRTPMITAEPITDAELDTIARARGFKLVDLDDYQYEMHQEHNAGTHDEPVDDCPDCVELGEKSATR
jgi:hypothetical protein